MLLLDDGSFRVTDVITLKDRDGHPLNGMPLPLRTATTETPLDGQGKELKQSLRGIDAEALVRLADGTFWVGEENAPSLAHFSADGKMIERHVPAGTEGDFAGAPYDVKGTLPAIVAKRQGNRGIEGIAISPDERFLYFIMQNPLANPDTATFAQARNTRLFKLERETMKVVGEYVYTLDDPQSFRRDPSKKQSDPRISELMAVGLDRLIVDERTEQTTKLYEIELAGATNIAGFALGRHGDAADLGAERACRRGNRAGEKDAALRRLRASRSGRQDRGHGAARRRRAGADQRRRFRHHRRPHRDRGRPRHRDCPALATRY